MVNQLHSPRLRGGLPLWVRWLPAAGHAPPAPPNRGIMIAMANTNVLECFDNPDPGRDYVIEHVAEQFTSVCPKTGHPDFGTVTIRFVADTKCVELKSLKLYLQSYRNDGIFYEDVTNRIADDLARLMAPRWLIVETHWRGRGGIHSRIRVEVGKVPDHER